LDLEKLVIKSIESEYKLSQQIIQNIVACKKNKTQASLALR